MIERDSVLVERARVKRRALNKKRGPKLWRWRVARLKRVKFRRRISWTRARWTRYHDERAVKRIAWRPYLKAIRLSRQITVQAEARTDDQRRKRRRAGSSA